jgi:hypothetical protein
MKNRTFNDPPFSVESDLLQFLCQLSQLIVDWLTTWQFVRPAVLLFTALLGSLHLPIQIKLTGSS